GRIDEALDVLEATSLEARDRDLKENKYQLARDWLLRGRLLFLRLQFTEATVAYDRAVSHAPDSFDVVFDAAAFFQSQNQFRRALPLYEHAQMLAINDSELARSLHNLGTLHHDQNQLPEAQLAYEKSLALSRKLAAINPETYLPDVARTLNNLANLHS